MLFQKYVFSSCLAKEASAHEARMFTLFNHVCKADYDPAVQALVPRRLAHQLDHYRNLCCMLPNCPEADNTSKH